MEIEIEWQKPLLLARHKRIRFRPEDLRRVDNRAGVYFFSRKYGDQFYPFYVGETGKLRSRLKQHMNNAAIVLVLMGLQQERSNEIAQGARYFHYGYFRGKPGQQAKKCLRIVQRELISEALANDCPLLNSQLVEFRTHGIRFTGKRQGRGIFPRLKTVEAT